MSKSNYEIVEEFSKKISTDMYNFFLEKENQGERFSWQRFPAMVARLASVKIEDSFGILPSNLSELKNYCHEKCVEFCKLIAKNELLSNPVYSYIFVSKSGTGICKTDQDILNKAIGIKWSEYWIDEQNMTMNDYRQIIYSLKQEQEEPIGKYIFNIIFYDNFPELLYLFGRARQARFLLYLYKPTNIYKSVNDRLIELGYCDFRKFK